MEELIEQYLFQHKRCPLPSLGSLQIIDGAAIAWHGDNKIASPVPQIEFSRTEISEDGFLAFIAAQNKSSISDAAFYLKEYCDELKDLGPFKEMILEQAGKFTVDETGELVFKQDVLPADFFPTISIQRVSHAKPTSHTLRVGDKETTREVMTEYYTEKDKRKRENWWVGALILVIIAAAVLFYYFRDHSVNDNFGNTVPVTTTPVEKTYQTK